MIIYLLKFSACLAIFLVFYKLVLERENMHHLKRYFLLTALVLSLAIPFTTFTQYVEPTLTVASELPVIPYEASEIETAPIEEPINYLPLVLWSLYGLGVLVFGVKFTINLIKIRLKITRNPTQKSSRFRYVLLNDLVIPHTFFDYIFLNKNKFESHQIPEAVFLHEQAHAVQKHSLDVIFIEFLQAVFWFNPLIYLTKHAIKLNHEFLADQSVLNKGIQPSSYQQILLAFSSNASEPQLANAINYSSIKKRFTVMNTHTSKQKIWLRSLLLLPLVALTLYGFSEKKEVIKNVSSIIMTDSIPLLEVKQNPLILTLNGKLTSLENLNADFRRITNDKISDLSIESNETVNISLLDSIAALLKPNLSTMTIKSDYGIMDDRPFDASQTSKHFDKNTPLLNFSNTVNAFCDHCTVEKEMLTTSTVVTSDKDAVQSFKVKFPSQKVVFIKGNSFNKETLKLVDLLDDLESIQIFDIKTKTGSIEGQMMVSFKSKQEKATPEEVAEYNKLAKGYNSQNPEKIIIKQKDVERLKFLYNKMDKEQKSKAEPFPNIVLPPPPPPAPEPLKTPPSPPINAKSYKTGFIEVGGNTIYYTIVDGKTTYYNRRGYIVDKNGNTLNGNHQVNASDVIPGQHISKVYKDDKIVAEFKADKNRTDFPEAPAPPAPKSPLDHVIEMAKKEASFYYEDKSISSDDAIQLLKENKELNISTKEINSKEPKVYISKEPIVIKQQTKSTEIVMLDGKKSKDGIYELTKSQLKETKLTIEKGTITEFKFKVPGKPTVSIKGNVLNEEAKTLIETLSKGDAVQLFLIKNSDSAVHPPILIEIE